MTKHSASSRSISGISGSTKEEIAATIRALIDQGELPVGSVLPPVRAVAEALGVHRHTALSAYKLLVQANLAETRGSAGTIITDPYQEVEEEGFAQGSVLRDLGNGNPDPKFLPNPTQVRLEQAPPRLYGETTIDPGLAEWATEWIRQDHEHPFRLTVTAGAVDAVERLLAQALTRGDAVALEDPCFLTSISTIRQNGYRALPVEIDTEGMLPESLRAALESGARAVVCTPRAHNPTGASLSATRAEALREVLADYPHVLVVEDDHFSLLSRSPYATIISGDRRRWALVRSMSKALGPDMRVALVASDTETAERLAARISGGITWVSHLLQRITHSMLTSPETMALIQTASEHYADRNAAFIKHLRSVGLDSGSRDGLNVWVDTGNSSGEVMAHLMRKGWIAREGSVFAIDGDHHRYVRFTVHDLPDAEMQRLAGDLAEATLERGLSGSRSRHRQTR